MFEIPEVSPYFYYGPVISYEFLGNVSKDKGKYRFRYELTFQNGEVIKKQQSGFDSIKEANQKKELLVHEILSGKYCPFDFTVQEFYNYWLFKILDEKKCCYSTFTQYQTIVRLYILPKTKKGSNLSQLTYEQLKKIVKAAKTNEKRKRLAIILKKSLNFAYDNNFIKTRYGDMIYDFTKMTYPCKRKKRDVAWSIEKIKNILIKCKENFPELYLPLLLSLTTGIRISEMLAIKYADIDFSDKTLHISRQQGKEYDPVSKTVISTEVKPKSYSSNRYIPLPDWVVEEIIVKRAWYEKMRAENPDFHDNDYIICRENGDAYYRTYFGKLLTPLLVMCGFEHIRWHDLRHIYATTLQNNSVNLKAISEFLGHASPEFSEEVYITKKEVVWDCTILTKNWEDIKIESDKPEILKISLDNLFSDKEGYPGETSQ